MVMGRRSACSRKKERQIHFGWVSFLISPAHLHVRPMGRTCRWAGEIGLTPPRAPRHCGGIERLTTRAGGRNRIDPHWGGVERLMTRASDRALSSHSPPHAAVVSIVVPTKDPSHKP